MPKRDGKVIFVTSIGDTWTENGYYWRTLISGKDKYLIAMPECLGRELARTTTTLLRMNNVAPLPPSRPRPVDKGGH